MDLSADLGKLKIDPNWMNASGIFANFYVLRKFPPETMGARVSKSIGIKPKTGFMEPVVYSNDIYTLNCVGLTNVGYKEAEAELKKLYPFPVPLIIDVFGTKDEMVEISKTLERYSDAIELNFGCPNLTQGENYGLAVGVDQTLVKEYTKAVRDNISSRKPIIAKLTPNVPDIAKIAKAAEEGEADIIAAINTISDGMVINTKEMRPILSNKFGGISGPAITPKGVGCVYKIYEAVELPIIGMGGIRLNTEDDYMQYVQAGASACAIGTDFKYKSDKLIEKNLRLFRRKIEEFCDEMNVSRIKELVGAAHQTKS